MMMTDLSEAWPQPTWTRLVPPPRLLCLPCGACCLCRQCESSRLTSVLVCLSVDHSRIKLHQEDNDYINASLIKMEEAQRSYILTQVNRLCEFFFDSFVFVGVRVLLSKPQLKSATSCRRSGFKQPRKTTREGKSLLSEIQSSCDMNLFWEAWHCWFCRKQQ